MSVQGPTSPPAACSGAMYSGVPSTMPLRVSPGAAGPSGWNTFAMPKSITFTLSTPSTSTTSTFSGLTSRCTMPSAWAWSSAAATCVASARARSRGSAPPCSITVRSNSAPTYSIARKQRPSSSVPESYTVITLGCCSRAAAIASRAKRAAISRLPASSSCRNFSATCRCSASWRARYTVPMAPSPTRSMSR